MRNSIFNGNRCCFSSFELNILAQLVVGKGALQTGKLVGVIQLLHKIDLPVRADCCEVAQPKLKTNGI